MDGHLAAYLRRVADVLSSEPTEPDIPLAVRALAQEHLADGVELEEQHRRLPDDSEAAYGRNLVWRDDQNRFVVVAMVWPPGIAGAPHDHGTWGVVTVLAGRVQVVDYRPPIVTADEVCLDPRCTVVAEPGQCAHVAPPPDDWHAVGNASQAEPALTLHTYGRDIDRCRMFDTASGQLETVEPVYTNV